MNIIYVSEQGFIGKIPDDLKSYRSDLAWMKMIDAFHVPYSKAHLEEDNELYSVMESADIILYVPSKKHPELMAFILQAMEQQKKVGVIQEGPNTYWHNWNTNDQLRYLSILKKANIILCHNEMDRLYFSNFTNAPIVCFRTVLDVPHWKEQLINPDDKEESVFVGGNLTRWYGGTHSYLLTHIPEIKKVGMPMMGQRQPDEDTVLPQFDSRVTYHPYKDWASFMETINEYKYAIHLMPESAAGSFSLNCAVLGIPCIGNVYNDTQRVLFPELSVLPHEIQKANQLFRKLITDKEFYDKVRQYALDNVHLFDMNDLSKKYVDVLEGVINERY